VVAVLTLLIRHPTQQLVTVELVVQVEVALVVPQPPWALQDLLAWVNQILVQVVVVEAHTVQLTHSRFLP
jgi:hypothetical protein